MKAKLICSTSKIEGTSISQVSAYEIEIEGKRCIIYADFEMVRTDHGIKYVPTIKLVTVEGMEHNHEKYPNYDEYVKYIKRYDKDAKEFMNIDGDDKFVRSELIEGEEIELEIQHFKIDQEFEKRLRLEQDLLYKETLQKLIDMKMQKLSQKRKISYIGMERSAITSKENIERVLQQYKEKLTDDEYTRLRDIVYIAINRHEDNYERGFIKYDSKTFSDEDIQKIIEITLSMMECVKKGKYDEHDLDSFIYGRCKECNKYFCNVVDVVLGNSAFGYVEFYDYSEKNKTTMTIAKKHGDLFSINKNYLANFSSLITLRESKLFVNTCDLNQKAGKKKHRLVGVPIIELDKTESDIIALVDEELDGERIYPFSVSRGYKGDMQVEEKRYNLPEELMKYGNDCFLTRRSKYISDIFARANNEGKSLKDIFAEEKSKQQKVETEER